MKPNWKNYTEVYDLYLNSSRVQRLWSKKKAIAMAEQISGYLFGYNKVEVINIHTGEIVYSN